MPLRFALTCLVLCALFGTMLPAAEIAAAPNAKVIKNVPVYDVDGRFGGWPANHGIWCWGNEIVVGFSAAWQRQQNYE